MVNIVEEQKKRIRYMYSFMFRRYKANTLVDGGTVEDDFITTDYLKMAQNNRMDKSIRFGWLGEAGSKIESGKVSKLYDINCFEQLGSELVTNGDFSNGTTGWAPSTNISVVNGELVYASPGQYLGVSKTITGLKIGSRYKLTGSLRRGTATSATMDIFGVSGTALNNLTTTPETKSVVFTATTTSHVINLFTGDVTAGATMIYDNISLKEVLNATNTNNATQSTPANQPYLSGNIAPNEKLGLKNPTGGSNFLSFNAISFNVSESWSFTVVLRWDKIDNSLHTLLNTSFNVNQVEILDSAGNTSVGYYGNNTGWLGSFNWNSNSLIGKNIVITVIKNGTTVSFYANNVLINQKTIVNFPFVFSRIIGTHSNFIYKAYIIHSQPLSLSQATAQYNYLRTNYVEIESNVIGSKTIETSNCEITSNIAGTVIANGNAQATWATNAAAYWCHHTNIDNAAIYGKLYNKLACKIIIASPPSGWHVATKAELQTIAALGGNALKATGSNYWNDALGTNTSGFTALGGGSRSLAGTFSTIKATAQIWCADTNEVMVINSANDTVTFQAIEEGAGYSIRLIKD